MRFKAPIFPHRMHIMYCKSEKFFSARRDEFGNRHLSLFTQILHNYYKKNIHNCRHGFHIVPTIHLEWLQIICDVMTLYCHIGSF